MRIAFCAIFAGLLLATHLNADELIITADGKGVWSTGSRKDGNSLLYTDRETGEERSIAAANVEAVMPAVQRGKAYNPEAIKENIKRLEELKTKHPSLLRPLNEISSAWKALLKSSPEFEAKINSLVDAFQKSDRSPEEYKKVTLELGMIKFKDIQGLYAAKIDESCENMRGEFVATNTVRLVKMAAAAKMQPDSFVVMKRLAEPVAEASDAAGKGSIQAMVEKARLSAFETGCSLADSTFLSGKSIEAYLKSAALLFLVKNEVASTEKQKAEVEKRIASLRTSAAKVLSSMRFDEDGFPMGDEDMQLLSKTRAFAQRVKFTDMMQEEEVMIVPLQSPGRLQMRQSYTVPFRIILNRAQPAGREYGVTVMMSGSGQNLKRTIPLKIPVMKNGRADVSFSDDFDGVPEDFSLSTDKRGGSRIYFFLACRDGGQKTDDAWKSLSSGWALQMSR